MPTQQEIDQALAGAFSTVPLPRAPGGGAARFVGETVVAAQLAKAAAAVPVAAKGLSPGTLPSRILTALRSPAARAITAPIRFLGPVGFGLAAIPIVASFLRDETEAMPGPEGLPSASVLARERVQEEIRTSQQNRELAVARERRIEETERRTQFERDAARRQAEEQAREERERAEALAEARAAAAAEAQARAELEARERAEAAAVERAAERRARELITTSQARSAEFAAFARSLPPGSTPVLGPQGEFRSLPAGSILTAADVAAGFEPLAFPSAPGPGPISAVIPGAFVGPGFRFQSVVEAQQFMEESRFKALRGLGG